MLLLPPRSTLFPYTTLFRSAGVMLKINVVTLFPEALEPMLGASIVGRARAAGLVEFRLVQLRDLDRKSTRLNSSHGYISYAVFCLKKKTQQEPSMAGLLHPA